MRLIRSSLVIALASSTLIAAAPPQVPAPAPEPTAAATPAPPSLERQQLARQYIQLTATADQFVDMFQTGMSRGIDQAAAGDPDNAKIKAEAQEDMARFMTLFEPKLRERMPNLIEAYAQVYAREFSAEELRQMISFAQTPAGKHFLTSQARVDLDPAILMQQEGFALDMMPIMEQIQKERCARHTAQRIAAGDKKAKCPLASQPETAAG